MKYMQIPEILSRWRQAEGVQEQRRQVAVLADLNLCTKAEMRELLRIRGETPPPLRKKQGGRKPFPRESLAAALDAGWTDGEIIHRLSVSKSTVWRWRREHQQKKVRV